jgi:CheY-like chemotaxis protein
MSSHPSTILVIEDDTDFRFMLNMWLRTAGYQVLEASHGGEGIELACTQRPNLIFMDLKMPVLDGLERHIPIIAISEHCWDHLWRHKALALGCVECMDKGKLIQNMDSLLQHYLN